MHDIDRFRITQRGARETQMEVFSKFAFQGCRIKSDYRNFCFRFVKPEILRKRNCHSRTHRLLGPSVQSEKKTKYSNKRSHNVSIHRHEALQAIDVGIDSFRTKPRVKVLKIVFSRAFQNLEQKLFKECVYPPVS